MKSWHVETFPAFLLSLLVTTPVLAAPDCSPTADQIDPRCYGAQADGQHNDGPALQAAINAAVANDLPLYLPHKHFRTDQELVIDYGQSPTNGNEGFLIKSDGATIDGTHSGTTVLTLACSGGTVGSPRNCFYFHQEGTLFVNGNTSDMVAVVGEPDFSDAQNSIRLDHFITNNSGTGGALQINYVLQSQLSVVADSAGNQGLVVRQMQFSTITLSASATAGVGFVLTDGYSLANTFLSPDLEASQVCQQQLSPYANGNAFLAVYDDCPIAAQGPLADFRGWGAAGVLGGQVKIVMDYTH
jgi:hypothetical protein